MEHSPEEHLAARDPGGRELAAFVAELLEASEVVRQRRGPELLVRLLRLDPRADLGVQRGLALLQRGVDVLRLGDEHGRRREIVHVPGAVGAGELSDDRGDGGGLRHRGGVVAADEEEGELAERGDALGLHGVGAVPPGEALGLALPAEAGVVRDHGDLHALGHDVEVDEPERRNVGGHGGGIGGIGGDDAGSDAFDDDA
mmetsp:Transcript_8517/g.34379  ORF Transcript_8517/g.34379 Transcript_8517/m.34379 type:complete len:200 (-) Transcript_8517:118-717(-)